MVLRGRAFNFSVVQEQYDWEHLITSQNPPGTGEQYLYGTCEETYPSCIDRDAHRVEKALGVRSKPFQRTVSDEVGNNSPQHIRTKQAICKAMQQLVGLVDTAREDVMTSELSSYIHDRFRAIRQELEFQRIRSVLTAKLLEPMIRLTAIKAHEMCQDRDYSAALIMDRKELAKMFVSLKALYTEHRKVGHKLSTEAEFTCYLILFKAEQDLQTAKRDGLAVLLLSTPDDILQAPGVRWALAAVDSVQQRNYIQFVKLLQSATYIQACFLHMLFLEEARESRIAAMTQAFKLKGALLSQLKDMMLMDSVAQVRAWLTMRDDEEVHLSEDGASVLLPANPRPRGCSTSNIITSALSSDGAAAPNTRGSPIAPMFTFPSPQRQQASSPQLAETPSPQQSPPWLGEVGRVRPAIPVAEPDLARAAAEHQASKQAAQPLVVEPQAAQQPVVENDSADQAHQESVAAEKEAAAEQAAKQAAAAAAAARKAADEREAAMQAAAKLTAQQAAAAEAEAKRRHAQEAARLDKLRREDEAFCRAGQKLEERERRSWAAAEEDYLANMQFTRQLRKRYREHLALTEAEEQAAAQAQEQADRLMLVQACSQQAPPSVTWRRLQQQASRDQERAVGVRSIVAAEMSLSRLQLENEDRGVTPGSAALHGGSTRGCGVVDGSSMTRPPVLAKPGIGGLAACAAMVPHSPDTQPVLQRPKVSAMRSDDLVCSVSESAIFFSAEVRGGSEGEKNDIPVVSRLRRLLTAKHG